jgi:hypothetical protein
MPVEVVVVAAVLLAATVVVAEVVLAVAVVEGAAALPPRQPAANAVPATARATKRRRLGIRADQSNWYTS